jgi:hypothetical protein
MRRLQISQRINGHIMKRRSLLFIAPLAFILVFVLAACGANTGTSTGAGSTPPSTPTKVTGTTGTTTGCPTSTTESSTQTKPNVTIQLSNSNSTVAAHNGDLIEVRLPFGQQWSGPTMSNKILQLQSPAGYTSTTDKTCVWRFVAQSTGTTQVSFTSKAICKPGQMCPLFVMNVPFTIDVK